MKDIRNQLKFAELIAGKILGSLSKEQKKVLKEWESDESNKKLEDDILNETSFSEWVEQREKVKTDQEWQVFLKNMQEKSAQTKVVSISIYRRIAAVAAVILVAVALYFSYQSIKSNSEESYLSASEVNIQPGTQHAELILSDGLVVDLESQPADIKQGNISIANTQGLLSYNDEEDAEGVVSVMNTLRVPRGAEYKLEMSDGTVVWLNSETELSYSVPFTGDERRVSLIGEAYFDVAPNKEKPFIISSGNQEVKVLGTEFNVSAYQEDATITTTLVEGKVIVQSFESGTVAQEENLLPNEQLVYHKVGGDVVKKTVDTYPFVSWKEGKFSFRNEPLEKILQKLSRWYDVEVEFVDNSDKEMKFSGDLPRDINMSSILKIIEAETSIKIQTEDNKKLVVSK